jgi:hypothetical protein
MSGYPEYIYLLLQWLYYKPYNSSILVDQVYVPDFQDCRETEVQMGMGKAGRNYKLIIPINEIYFCISYPLI